MFLKIATKNRKLIDLSKNIKCGNSLIEDSTVDAKAFNWAREFPFKFDIVIGNPPYVRQERLGHYKKYFEKNYKVYNFASDIFAYFYEKSISLLKEDGLMSFISNTFSKTTASLELRSFLTSNVQFIRFADFTNLQLFDGATTYPIIMLLKKDFKEDNKLGYFKVKQENLDNLLAVQDKRSFLVEQRTLDNENWTFESEDEKDLKSRIKAYPNIKSIFGRTFRGIITGLNEAFIVNSKKMKEIISKIPETKEFFKPYLEGKDLKKWTVIDADKWLILFPKGWTKQILGESVTEENGWTYIKERYPPIAEHLEPFKAKAKQRYDKGDFWWELRACGYYNHFENEKIVWPNLQSSNKFSYGDKGFYINAPAVILPIDDKSLLCVLNSKLAWFFFQDMCVVRSGGYIEVKPQYFEQFPYRKPENESTFTKIADLIINLNEEFYSKKQKFIRRLTENLKLVRVTKKLDTFYELDLKEFLEELSKQKINLSLNQQDEWEDYFNKYKHGLIQLQNQINTTDKEINQMVYDVYGLTKEEIIIIENG